MLKHQTQHDCPFCKDFIRIKSDYMMRRLHNLAVLLDMCELVKNKSKIPEVTKIYLPNYLKKIIN